MILQKVLDYKKGEGLAGQIQRFQSQINQGEGTYLKVQNRYLIVIHNKLRLTAGGLPQLGRQDDVNELKMKLEKMLR